MDTALTAAISHFRRAAVGPLGAVAIFANEAERRRRARRTAVILGLVALAFYVGFIAIGVFKA